MLKNNSAIVILVAVLFGINIVKMSNNNSESDNYLKKREQIIRLDSSNTLGKDLILSKNEIQVSEILLKEKFELQIAYEDSSRFLPLLNFLEGKELIDKSRVFQIIKKIPKGASLHTHLLAAVSVDFLMKNVTYMDNLYGGYINGVFKLKFLKEPEQDNRTEWKEIRQMRFNNQTSTFDEWLKDLLSFKHQNFQTSQELLWKKFKQIFTTSYEMLAYRPVFEIYVYQMLQELYDDNVTYTELKGTMMTLYELNGHTYDNADFFRIFSKTVNRFKQDNPGFLGVRYIHSVYRGVDQDTLKNDLREIVRMKKLFPDFIAGFDFVGFEEEGHFLIDYHNELLEVTPDLQFFFHAGETNWFGHTDLNLIDAILLNSSRIGHGFALPKHPSLLELARKRDIPVEVCPISNQVLMLHQDPRSHPATYLLASGYPLVIGNDDPSIWGATGLSYDWYFVFMAMVPRESGLEVLKKLAINSFKYSAMGEQEKTEALDHLEVSWKRFSEEMVNSSIFHSECTKLC